MELGLCCLFHKEPIKFKTYTKTALLKLNENDQYEKVHTVLKNNLNSLQDAINYCRNNGIKTYRVSSDLIPHYDTVSAMFDIEWFFEGLRNIDATDVNLSMHPGQFVNLGSPKPEVVENSLMDLHYHRLIADALGFSELNIHLGGTYGDKESAKSRFIETVNNNPWLKDYLTIENDELNYHAEECVEVCKELGIPMTFDIHHERCYRLGKEDEFKSMEEIFRLAESTWSGDFMRMHISTPKDGYSTPAKSRPHHDYIDSNDFPTFTSTKTIYIDVEAKAKESAIFQLRESLSFN